MKLIDGKQIAEKIYAELADSRKLIADSLNIGVILASNDEASKMYVKMKTKKAEEFGIKSDIIEFDKNTKIEDILNQINAFNADDSITGIHVQLPVFDHLKKYTSLIVNTISPRKDIDGLTAIQQGGTSHLLTGSILSATVEAILECINDTTEEDLSWDAISGQKVDLENNFLAGKNILIINNSNLIGKPLSQILTSLNATVTIANKLTDSLINYSTKADIVITATGKPQIFDHTYFKNDATVIDVTSVKQDEKIVGDVIVSKELTEKIAYLTPVPGGVGPLTIACLIRNILRLTSE